MTATTRPLLVQVAGAGSENVYFSTHSLMDPNLGTDAVKKFIAAYQAEYKTPPENAFAGLGYDTMKLIADSIKRAGSADAKEAAEGPAGHAESPRRHRLDHLPAGQPHPAEGRDHRPREGRRVHPGAGSSAAEGAESLSRVMQRERAARAARILMEECR